MSDHPLLYTRDLFKVTPWQTFAMLTALTCLCIGLGFLFYPGVYSISKGYAAMSHLIPNAKLLGAVVVALALSTLYLLPRQRAAYPLTGLVAFLLFLASGSAVSVGLSSGTALYTLWACKAIYALLRSGGFRRRGL